MRKYNFSGIGSAPTGAVAPIYKTKEQAEEEKNKGGVLGGLGYLGEKTAASFMQSVEGIWDYTAGGLAKLFGADDWAEAQFQNDWFGDWYSHPDEWYNPGEGWKVAGDVAGGIGTSLPGIAAVGIGAAVAYFSGGTLSPVAVGLISAGTAGLGAAGTSTKQAYQETGKLGGAEFGYGALSGTVEGTTEGITNALTLGTGAVVKNIGKAFGKEMTETVAKQGVLKGLFGAFAGEAFEEGLSEWVNPYLAQMTYDPNAEEATAQEIAYAAFVGGLSGMVMQGGNVAIDSGSSFARGTSIANRGLEGEVLNLSAQIAAFQDANNTENEAYRTVAETYKKLSESLAQTGGAAETAAQRKMLGDLSRANVAAVFSPMITRSAAQIYANADVIAARLTEYGYKDANGKPMTFTAEQIREGIVPGDKKSFEKALKTNSVLRTLAVASTTGQLTMDTRAFRDATLAGRNLASRADLWSFAENATADEVRAVSEALGIENWETLTEDEFAEKIATFLREGGAERYAAERAAEERIFADTGAAMPLPPTIALEDGQSRKFTDGERELAIARRGEEYRIYDMATRTGTKAMSRAEVNKALADEREKRQSILAEAKENERRSAEIKRKREETDAWARENVKKYAELSAQSKTVVRKVIAAARASGLSEADVQMYATVSAHAGLDIVFSKRLCKVEGGYADAFWDPGKNRIVVNPEAKRSAEKILLHELDHAVRSGIRKDGGTQVFAEAIFGIDTEAAQKITARYKNVKSEVSQAELIWDEANAYFAETFFANKNVLESLTEKVPTLKERILGFFSGAKKDYAGAPKLEGAAKRYYTTYKKMFDEFAERNADRNAEEARISGKMGDARFSLQFADTIAEDQRKFVIDGKAALTKEELELAIEQTAEMVAIMSEHKDILPEDKTGKTLVKNGSYDYSVENTTICVRTLAYNSFTDMVSEKIGRPLSQMESFLVSQKLYEIAKEPQCLYCYVSLDRKAYNEMILRYITQRDEAIAEYVTAGKPKVSESSEIYKKFLAGRKPTPQMWARYKAWTELADKGAYIVNASDVATEAKRADLARKNDGRAAQVKDMLKYAQSASWAKKQTQYVAYFDDIRKLSQTVVNNLNKHYGLRWYSFSDYSGAFIVENMQQVTDAAIRGLKGLAYTKDTDYARIFAPTGMNINISVYAKKTENGYAIDEKQSANIEEAIELRKQFPNVGIVVVATDADGVEWALNQEWSDVVIPFHTVRTGADVADFYKWEIFNTEQNDTVSDENLWNAYVQSVSGGNARAAKKVSKMIYPSEHQNNRETYMRLLHERGLSPRFKSFLGNPNYMKLVNETRQSESQTKALRATYDLDAAKKSFDKFVKKGGYFEGWYNDGIDVDNEASIVASDIAAGRKANEVEYGRQDIMMPDRRKVREHGRRYALPEDYKPTKADKEYISALERGDMDAAQAIVEKAASDAMPDTVVRDENGKLLKVYHATKAENGEFYVFDYSQAKKRGGFGFKEFGKGNYFSKKDLSGTRYGSRVLGVYLNIQNPYIPDGNFKDSVKNTLGIEGSYDDIQRKMIEMGYDGVISQNEVIMVTFSSEQIKLADTVTYDNDGNVIPVSKRFTQNNADIRYALPMEDDAIDAMLDEMREDGVVFDPEGIIAKGAPVIPDSPRAKIHTRARAYMVFEKLADNNLLSNKSRKEFFDVLYKAMNSFETATEKQSFAREAAEFYVARLLTEAKTENPNVRPAHRRLSWLNIGVGKLSFSPSDIAEMRAVLDESEFRKIFGRWGRKTSGTPSYMLDMFINEVSTTIPGMSYIGRMHPVEALLELDKMYEEARKTITVDKYISAYWDSTDDDILAMVKSAEDAIINGFDAQDKAIIEEKLETTRELAESYKEQFDTLRGTIRYRGYIASRVEKLIEMKKGIFQNSSVYKDDTFDKILGKLTSIEWRKNLSVTRVRGVMKDIANWYTKENALLGYVDKNNVGYYDESIAEKMQALANGDGAISAAELAELDQVLGYLTKFIETYNKVYINGKWVDALPVAKAYVDVIRTGPKLREGFFRDINRKYLMTFGDTASVMRYYDRYSEGGFFTETFERLREAAVSAETEQMKVMRDYEAFMKKNPRYLADAEGAEIEFAGAKLPKMTAISLYMTMSREQARAGLAASGFKFTDINGKSVRAEGFATNTELTDEAILSVVTARQNELYAMFSDADKKYIGILEKAYNEQTRKLKADRDMERYGFTNVMTDYYYPIRRANTAKSVDTSFSAELDRVSNASFNKDVVKGAKGELFIQNADTLFRNHVRAVCQYATLSPAIEAYNKLFNMDVSGNPNKPVSVKTESENVWSSGDAYFRALIGDIQGIPRTRGEGMEALAILRGGYAKFQLGANPKTWASQLSSLFAATSVLDVSSIAASAGISGADVDKYCAIAELRNADNTAAMAQGVLTPGKRIKNGIDKVSDALMKPIGSVDRFVVTRLFAACRAQVEKNGGPKIDTEQNRVEAGRLLERVILETQQNSFATERSAAMRSGNEIMRTLTMFSADGMKVFGRVIDAFGEASALRQQMKGAAPEAKAELGKRLESAKKRLAKSTGALTLSSVYMVLIAQLFRHIYNKDEEESTAAVMLADFGSSMVGGLPLVRDLYTRLTDGFGMENYAISAMNDMMDSASQLISLSSKILQGSATAQDGAKTVKNLAYSVGQLSGIPVRNVYNVLYGLTKRFSPETAYGIDGWFYKKNYENDLKKAIAEGDDRMAQLLLSLAVNEKTGSALSATAHTELHRLISAGYKILPREIGKTITVDGNEYEMSEEEREMVRAAYASVTDKLDTLFANRAYTLLSDTEKEEAIRYLYNTAYSEAIADVYGIDRGNAPVIADVLGYDVATLAYMRTKGIESDKGKDGKSLPGTKKKKTVAAINALNISTEKKLFLICAKGYSLADGDVRGLTAQAAKKKLLAYILALPGKTKDEKAMLAEMCGFAVKNGKISLKNTA